MITVQSPKRQFALHRVAIVVVARNAQDRPVKRLENATEASVALRVLVHEVAGCEQRGKPGEARQGVVHDRTQARIGLHAAQGAAGLAV
jgi:hypothetical protein